MVRNRAPQPPREVDSHRCGGARWCEVVVRDPNEPPARGRWRVPAPGRVRGGQAHQALAAGASYADGDLVAFRPFDQAG